jgi:anthranilate/para-aminobenzoate synthase component II
MLEDPARHPVDAIALVVEDDKLFIWELAQDRAHILIAQAPEPVSEHEEADRSIIGPGPGATTRAEDGIKLIADHMRRIAPSLATT